LICKFRELAHWRPVGLQVRYDEAGERYTDETLRDVTCLLLFTF